MAIDTFPREELREIDRGLAHLGWATNHRLTSDDTLILKAVADKAERLADGGLLDEGEREALAVQAYDVLRHYLSDPRERAWAAQARYCEAPGLADLVPVLDEATLAFLRGYHTAAFALLLVVLERYLRTLSGWQPGDPDVTFATLRRAVSRFAPSRPRVVAQELVDSLYSRFDALRPPAFLFNRHGLLHGLRAVSDADEMNCARLFFLFDLLSACERSGGAETVIYACDNRLAVYSACVQNEDEMSLLSGRAAGETGNTA